MNVDDAPEHFGFVPEVKAIETDGATFGLTVIVIPEEVAVGVVRHVAFDVITQLTICPFVIADDVNVALLVPAFTPFTNH